jgi:hypothetical protein
VSQPRLVIATRPTVYEHVLDRHGTVGQARFFLQGRGQSLDDLHARHEQQAAAVATIDRCAPRDWRRARVQRAEFDRFLFQDGDLVVAVGQDGLVANLAKDLHGQPLIGCNPSPDWFDGVLVRHVVESVPDLLRAASGGRAPIEHRTMVRAERADGLALLALNEVFVGHQTHQSARYRIRCGERSERQSSSGMIVASGTGATGWARSIHGMCGSALRLPKPTSPRLVFFVREAFPSQVTGTTITQGVLDRQSDLEVQSEMDDGGVVFGDGIEADRLDFPWGSRLRVRRGDRTLSLVA